MNYKHCFHCVFLALLSSVEAMSGAALSISGTGIKRTECVLNRDWGLTEWVMCKWVMHTGRGKGVMG